MPDACFMESHGREILLIDLSAANANDVLSAVIDRAIALAGQNRQPGSLRTVLDLSGTRINGDVMRSLKRLSMSNGRYAKATAFVGLGAGWSCVLSTFFFIKGKRNHKVFSRRDVAVAWLETW